jgi:hypothetical protein
MERKRCYIGALCLCWCAFFGCPKLPEDIFAKEASDRFLFREMFGVMFVIEMIFSLLQGKIMMVLTPRVIGNFEVKVSRQFLG